VAEVFARLDTDGSGTLDLTEVEQLAAALGVVLSQASAAGMFEQMDADGVSTRDPLLCGLWPFSDRVLVIAERRGGPR
jgi:hypothetical protein